MKLYLIQPIIFYDEVTDLVDKERAVDALKKRRLQGDLITPFLYQKRT